MSGRMAEAPTRTECSAMICQGLESWNAIDIPGLPSASCDSRPGPIPGLEALRRRPGTCVPARPRRLGRSHSSSERTARPTARSCSISCAQWRSALPVMRSAAIPIHHKPARWTA